MLGSSVSCLRLRCGGCECCQSWCAFAIVGTLRRGHAGRCDSSEPHLTGVRHGRRQVGVAGRRSSWWRRGGRCCGCHRRWKYGCHRRWRWKYSDCGRPLGHAPCCGQEGLEGRHAERRCWLRMAGTRRERMCLLLSRKCAPALNLATTRGTSGQGGPGKILAWAPLAVGCPVLSPDSVPASPLMTGYLLGSQSGDSQSRSQL